MFGFHNDVLFYCIVTIMFLNFLDTGVYKLLKFGICK